MLSRMMRNGPIRRNVRCLSQQTEVVFNLMAASLKGARQGNVRRSCCFGFSRRFWWDTRVTITSMKGTKWRLLLVGSLDIGHSDGSTSASEVTAEAGGSPMFMVQIRPLSRCTEHRNEVLDT